MMTLIILSIRRKLTPPVKAHADAIGNDKIGSKIKIKIEENSFPDAIFRGDSNVENNAANVLFSFSYVIDVAENAGTNKITSVKFTLKNIEKICLLPSAATDCIPLEGHSNKRSPARIKRYAVIKSKVRGERTMVLNSR